jgi:integrase
VPKRRPKGEGSISQRSDGRWQASFVVEVDGRKTRKYVYAPNRKSVQIKLKTAMRDRDRGALVMRTVTVETWFDTWLKRQAKKLKPQTLRSYKSKTDLYILPTLGRHRLTALNAGHIEAAYDRMRDAGLAEATIRQTHAILKKALSDAIKRDQLAISPMDKVEPPGTQKNARAQFNTDQARQVLRAAGDNARWWLALFYGMRQGEVLGLDWEHIDLERHTLTIAQTLQTDTDGHLFLGSPKTEKSQRTLPLVPLMEARLRLLWETEGRPTSGLLFHNGNGQPVQPKRDWKNWRNLIDTATVPPFAPLPYIALHAARNTAASLLETARVPDRLVMQILGQTQVQTTHGYQTADLDRIGQAFGDVGRLLELE